jgi:hypothetical protein
MFIVQATGDIIWQGIPIERAALEIKLNKMKKRN